MKPNHLTAVFAALVITGVAVSVVLSLQRRAETKRASAPQTTTARELPGAVKSLVRDVAGGNPSELPRTTRGLHRNVLAGQWGDHQPRRGRPILMNELTSADDAWPLRFAVVVQGAPPLSSGVRPNFITQ